MAEFKLSARAEADLLDIYDYTNSTFGTYQADAYHAGLERTFDLLANFPRIGASVNDTRPGTGDSGSRRILYFTPKITTAW